ncbi:MAG: diguanylate cyclase [Candidatus Thiodiazotropha sp. (ex Lucinoma borealis)]|nr:diguanylate cyclase [Candidatus Thiodiazotropha sp. (ex Lucinoma borealis)]MCU7870777.1 diguanylate cyclase [Candidatus Thiodiazotropha sp. (ex Lucinoma borealis)]
MNTGKFIRYYLLLVVITATLGGLLYWAIYQQTLNSIVNEFKLESNNLINQLTKQLSLAFIEIHSDLRFLTEQRELHALFSSAQKEQQPLQNLQASWKSLALQRNRYDQLRFLDIDGLELIRINFNMGNPESVSRDKLQSKKYRYYFTESIGKPPGTIYSSPLDLNIEDKIIELPLKPTIRFASSVSSSDGKIFGIVILNYLARNLLDNFRRVSAGYPGHAILLNWQGYTLLSPESAQDWGFMFPDSAQEGINVKHAEAWQTIQDKNIGQVLNNKGLYTFDFVHPSGEELKQYCSSCLRILLHIPSQLVQAKLWQKLSQILPVILFSLSFLVIILGIALWNRLKRSANELQIQSLNQQISYEHDLFLNGPGIIAKLRNELGWPVEFISSNVQDLLGYGASRFTNGELTFSNIIDPEYLSQYSRETYQADLDRVENFKRSLYKIIDQQNRTKWIQDNTHIIRDKTGRLTHFFVHINDVTPLKEAEEQLTRSHEYIQKVVDTIADPTMVIDINNHQLKLVNQSALKLYTNGKQLKEGMTCFRLSHKRNTPCKGDHDPCPINQILKSKKSVSVIHKHYKDDGEVMHIDVRATPIFDEKGGQIVQIIESHRDITQTVIMEKQLQHIAETDRLTQIFNRMKFDEELKNQIAWASLTNNHFGLIMLDLDHFKQVNDNYGHDVGDQVLKRTVELLHKRIRKSDILARWGGEEFMIIAPLINQEELTLFVESLRSAMENIPHEGVGVVTASFGASVLNPNDNIQSLIKRVDTALYQSKKRGRNRCTIL